MESSSEDRRVLLAEDEEATAALLVMLLRSWGYAPTVVDNGRAALEVLEAPDPPPLALLDWMMPGLDGPSVCRAVRAAKPREGGPFLVLLTARTNKEDIVAGLEAGADDYVTKPFDFGELKARLERARRSTPPGSEAAVGHGTVLDGRWRIDALIGKGGMGTVWRGTHASLGTPVAIKLIRDDFIAHPETRARFEREARAASAIRSPFVAEVLDYGLAPGGRPYLVMELLEGSPLSHAIAERGPLPAWEVAQLVRQLAKGLERVHEAGIVHRDLKPDNVFLATPKPGAEVGALPYTPKLVDFGVALDLGRASVTEAGVAVGTVAYMSPEQMHGALVGATSDVWALGALAFEAMTGVSPFDGGSITATSVRVSVAPLPKLTTLRPELPPGVDAWFASACARDSAQRFQSARELGDALYVAAGGGSSRRAVSLMPPMWSSAPPTPRAEPLPAPAPTPTPVRAGPLPAPAPTPRAMPLPTPRAGPLPAPAAPAQPARPARQKPERERRSRREKREVKEKAERKPSLSPRAVRAAAETLRAPPPSTPSAQVPIADEVTARAPSDDAAVHLHGAKPPGLSPTVRTLALLLVGALLGAIATALALRH